MMKKLNIIQLLGIFQCVAINISYSQDVLQNDTSRIDIELNQLKEEISGQRPGINRFLLSGYSNISFNMDVEDMKENSFGEVGFVPIFLWMPSDKLFFEAEMHIELVGGSAGSVKEQHGGVHGTPETGEATLDGTSSFGLGYVNMNYMLGKNLILSAGRFLSPLGTFSERYHPSWINRLPDSPLGFGHDGVGPAEEVGVQLRGGIQMGKSKINYSVYVSNGPMLNDGSTEPDKAGKLQYSNFADNNGNKAVGGRVGLLPFSNSSLEIGASGQYAKTGTEGTLYESVAALLYAGDISFVQENFLKGILRLNGQWNAIQADKMNYVNDSALIAIGKDSLYSFDNNSSAYFAQLAFRPSLLKNKVIKKMEFVVRYDAIDLPSGAMWETDDSRITAGVNYWIHSRSAFKFAFQVGELRNALLAQFVIGF